MLRGAKRLLPALTLILCTMLLAACQNGAETQALIQSPAVGDVYAAQLSEFSDYEFTDDQQAPLEPAYGLLKVIQASGDNVVVVTENAAAATKANSLADIRSDLSHIQFDDSERIEISLADLAQAHTDGLIYAAVRPDAK